MFATIQAWALKTMSESHTAQQFLSVAYIHVSTVFLVCAHVFFSPTNTVHCFAFFFFFLGVIVILVLLPVQCFLHHCRCPLPFGLYALCKCGMHDSHDLHLQFHQTMPECVAVVMKSLDTGIKRQTSCVVVQQYLIVDCHI